MFVGVVFDSAENQLRETGLTSHEDRVIADIKRQLASTFNAAKSDNYPEAGKKD